MARLGHLLQINIYHCSGAEDLLMQSMAELCIELSVIAEPYKVQKCPNWGSNLSKSVAILRGAIGGLDLPLLYSGHVSTSIRWQGESIVVTLWNSPATFGQVAAWKVLEDKETLSDHRYIGIALHNRRERNRRCKTSPPCEQRG